MAIATSTKNGESTASAMRAERQIHGPVQSIRPLTRYHIDDGLDDFDFSNGLDRPRAFDRLSVGSLRSSRATRSSASGRER